MSMLSIIGVRRLARDTKLYAPSMPVLELHVGDWVNVISMLGTRVRIEREGYYAVVPQDVIA